VKKLLTALCDISRIVHGLHFKDTNESLCSRAWRLRDSSLFWALWCKAFGQKHCRESFDRYWLSKKDGIDP
jgi:hypothetical protein